MSVNRQELHDLIERLRDTDMATVYDFMQFLIDRGKHGLTLEELDQLEPVDEPPSEELTRQLSSPREYITGEDAKREFGLQVDLP